MVQVRADQRADGTRVRAHSRWAAGARGEMAIVAVIALVVVGFSGSGAGSASGRVEGSYRDWTHPPRSGG